MKAKREFQVNKVSSQSLILSIILAGLAILTMLLGDFYQVPSRFTLPVAILLFWVSGSIALWNFRKGAY